MLLRSALPLWTAALIGSALLVAAGERWPQALQPDGRLVWSLVLMPSLLLGAWILLPGPSDPPGRGESSD
jgi:hypothetical protein